MASKWEDWTNGFRINVKDFLSIIFTATSAMSDLQTLKYRLAAVSSSAKADLY